MPPGTAAASKTLTWRGVTCSALPCAAAQTLERQLRADAVYESSSQLDFEPECASVTGQRFALRTAPLQRNIRLYVLRTSIGSYLFDLLGKSTVRSMSRCPLFIASDLSGFAFSSPPSFRPFSPPSSRWECGNPAFLLLAGFPSAEGSVGNSLWSLEFSTLSSVRHFHSVAPALFSNFPAARP
jgi:hypothetical protein